MNNELKYFHQTGTVIEKFLACALNDACDDWSLTFVNIQTDQKLI